MDSYIKISTLNDFTFCPKSIYFHELYSKYDSKNYHQKEQTEGKLTHQSIDKKTYSTSKKILQGISVFSEKYNLCGKIDIYHIEKRSLMERKTYVEKIYKGYVFQLYAQYFCMIEMWYDVERLRLYSMKDNKVYGIILPWKHEINEFERFLDTYIAFDINNIYFRQNSNKCKKCIYRELCDLNL